MKGCSLMSKSLKMRQNLIGPYRIEKIFVPTNKNFIKSNEKTQVINKVQKPSNKLHFFKQEKTMLGTNNPYIKK